MINLEVSRQVICGLKNDWFKTIAKVFSQVVKLKYNKQVSLALVSDREIKKWNSYYRGKNQPTDVLSFVATDREFVDPEENFLGEIIISVPRARAQAKKYGHSLKQEMARLLVHGLAHLLGYDHENVSTQEAEKMVALEKQVMASLGFESVKP